MRNAAWLVFAFLPPAAVPPPAPPPAPPVPSPADAGPVFDPPDEDVLKENKISADAAGLLDFFRQRMVQADDEARIKGLIRQLGDDDFDRREDASLQLEGLGLRAKPFLLAAQEDDDAEVAHRVRACLRHIDEGASAAATSAAIRVLARLHPDGASDALLNYLPSAGDETLAEQARLSLADLAMRDGKADAALVKALTDPAPARRGAAAFALARGGAQDQLPAVRKLLDDADPLVRYRAALALAGAGEKSAVPVLIDQLDQLPRPEAARAEELLYRVADEHAPAPPTAFDMAARRKHRDAWKAWWDDNTAKVDAGRLAEAARTVGFTLVVLLDQGRVLELDSANHPRLQISQLNFPLDAQLLPDDHVLVAEHNGNRVTERDAKNAVVWEKQIEGPLVAQRLPNKNTFIATRSQMIEVKPNGDEAFSWTSPNNEVIMKAQKLPNGDVALVTQLGQTRFVLLDSKGKERRSFNVDLNYSGGRIDVLPNGNVLVPEAANNQVVEMDPRGNVVWQASLEGPIAAVRLADGDTLVTTYAQHRAVEIDHEGKEVWEVRRNTRVTRAFRR